MKKSILSLIVIFLSVYAFGQDTNKQAAASSIQFGIKGGINIANLENVKGTFVTPNNDSRIGYHVGALAHFHVHPNFAVQPEVMFSAQGFKNPSNKYIVNYINIPLLAQYMFSNGLRLQTGPQLGILAEAHTEDYAGNENAGLKTFLKSTDFSWTFGAGYLLPMGLGADVRYNLGLSNIRTSTSDVVKNRIWQLGLFYQFRR